MLDVAELETQWWQPLPGEPRPWEELVPKRRRTIPIQQTQAYERTKRAVANATAKAGLKMAEKKAAKGAGKATGKEVLQTVGTIARDVLEVSADVLEYVPIPAVAKVANILLKIWEAAEDLETNRLACLRLTERAAEILDAICSEIHKGGPQFIISLRGSLDDLECSFGDLFILIEKQAHRPFLKRYIKRDDDQKKIEACEKSLTAALCKFDITVLLRVLKSVEALQESVARLEEAAARNPSHTPQVASPAVPSTPMSATPPSGSVLAVGLTLSQTPMSSSSVTLTPQPHSPTTPRAPSSQLPAFTSVYDPPSAPEPSTLAEQLREMDSARAKIHAILDQRDMLDRIGAAVRDGSDAAVFDLLQIPQRELPEAQFALRRALEDISSDPASLQADEAGQFHREFLELSVDALHRLSDYRAVPAYTITKYEFDRDNEVIGYGSFGHVFKGTWRNETIAIKVLAPMTPQTSFRREVEIWRLLKHRHVLPLWAASSPAAGAPFFCVSPYMANGNLPQYLRRNPDSAEHLRLMHEIAMGMAYLHSRQVIHGDMKAANVLVDDQHQCVIADFGQSDIRDEVYRLSGRSVPHGTVRWSAPEIIFGEGVLTTAVDVYAFAICCHEIMKNGDLPWPRAEDAMIPHFVAQGRRPTLPDTPVAELLAPYIASWWTKDPQQRPAFSAIAVVFEMLRGLEPGWDADYEKDSPKPPTAHNLAESMFSPPLQPGLDLPDESGSYMSASISDESYYTSFSRNISSSESGEGGTLESDTTSDTEISDYYTNRRPSPPPVDELASYRRDERRYRTRLQHRYNESLTLPLWKPTKVEVGDVGFMDRGKNGTFVRLFNAFGPPESHGAVMFPPLVATRGRRLDKRDPPVAVRPRSSSLRARIPRLLAPKSPPPESPKEEDVTFKLHFGHKEAFLFTESTHYQYLEALDTAKPWFSDNIDLILHLYGRMFKLQREDIFLVIGTLDAAHWAAYVCHCATDLTMRLTPYPYDTRQVGKPWAEFAPGLEPEPDAAGPSYQLDETFPTDANWKVSMWHEHDEKEWESVLLARLCFKPDRETPTRGR
ncbi:hypothetical protein EXIGLDRAFT_720865 [Exidia glandulosa HHB12029]|uniref:Protein kinase domain-containing protein n=1 Tax=Exidia glandulosa HHB12029 TaxID=1314781 RepID=A0A166BFM3_EXIGL|nr:hypothetical protein EXIGLDRAFT_720865 [Exidia glandulosa HHB12029]